MTPAHVYRQKFALLLLDILAFLMAFTGAMHLRFNAGLAWFEPGTPPWEPMLQALPVMLAAWLMVLRSCGLYSVDRRRLFFELARMLNALLVFLGILLSITFFYRGFSYSRGFTLLFLPALVGLTFTFRVLFRVVRARIEGIESHRQRVILIGNSPVTRHLIEHARSPLPELSGQHLEVVGVLADDLAPGATLFGDVQVLGAVQDLKQAAKQATAHGVIIADARMDQEQLLRVLDVCLANNLEWQMVPSAYELMLDRVTMDVVAGVPVLGIRRSNIRGANRLVKRLLDIVVATVALALLWPLMLAVALFIKLRSKGPVLFAQDRVGENGEVFRFLKFRTMHVNNDDSIHREYAKQWITQGQAHEADAEGKVYKITRDPRIIRGAEFLRKYSVDELPQLFNVLRGDMSLVGPRPPIPYEVDVYREWHRRRFEGPPGITGLWQVSGRNRLSFDEMVKLDIEYLENWSFARDLKILWRTMGVVLFDRAY